MRLHINVNGPVARIIMTSCIHLELAKANLPAHAKVRYLDHPAKSLPSGKYVYGLSNVVELVARCHNTVAEPHPAHHSLSVHPLRPLLSIDAIFPLAASRTF